MSKKQKKILVLAGAFALAFGIVPNVSAMHIMEGYLPGGEAGLGYKPARNLLDQWQIEDVIQEFYNSILERKVNGIRYSLKGFWDKYTGSGVVFSENLIKAYRQAYCQAA